MSGGRLLATSFHGFSIRRPRLTLLLGLLVVAAVSPGLSRLRLRTDGNALVPEGAPEIAIDQQIRDRFDFQDQTIVVIDTRRPDGIYDTETLELFIRLTERLGEIERLRPHDVTSLATERVDRVYTGSLRFRTFIDPFPTDDERMAQIKEDVDVVGLYTGTLVSLDASALAILINTPRDIDRSVLHDEVQRALVELGDVPEDIYIAGAPIAESQLGTHILEDLLGSHALRLFAHFGAMRPAGETFLPGAESHLSLILVTLAVMAVVFFIAFRSVPAVLLPLMEVGACLVFTFSLMGWCDVPVYLTIAVLPVILTAIGVADELHIFSRYRRALRDDPDSPHPAQLSLAMSEMWRPITKTSVTSAIGFLSFSLSPMAPVKMFGLFMAVGIAFCLFWSLTVIPASLALIDPNRVLSRAKRASSTNGGAWRGFGGGVMRFRWVCILGVLGLAASAPQGIRKIIIQDSWVDAFSPGSAMHNATDLVNDKFFGAHLLLVEVDATSWTAWNEARAEEERHPRYPVGPLCDPAAVKMVGGLERFLEKQTALTVGGVQGYHELLTTAHFLFMARKQENLRVPDDVRRISQLLDWYRKLRTIERLDQMIDPARERCLITAFLKDANFVSVGKLIEDIRAYEREKLAPLGVKLNLAGDVAVSQAMIGGIVRTQTRSLLLSLVGIVAITTLLFRSPLWGVLSVLPAGLAVLMNFAVMGWFQMPLGVATSMFSGMTIGIGVDYAIHLLERYRMCLRSEPDGQSAVRKALSFAGPAILIDAVAIALAFSVLSLSQVPANRRLGALVLAAVVSCLLATFVLLPALLSFLGRSSNRGQRRQ